ncbi:hypothetical protein Btru_006551 [Bulinus truncatus]|nr:hypothetical protein Btru_006551 [Bulinus truncatus]
MVNGRHFLKSGLKASSATTHERSNVGHNHSNYSPKFLCSVSFHTTSMEGAEGDWAVFCPKRVHLGENLEPFRRFSEFMFQPIKEEPESAPSDSEIAEVNEDKSGSLDEFSDNRSAIEWNIVCGPDLASSSESSCDFQHVATCDRLALFSNCFADESSSEVQRILADATKGKSVGGEQKLSATPRSNILPNVSESCGSFGPETKKNTPRTNLYIYNIATESSNAERSVKTNPYWELCQEESNVFVSSCGMSCSLSLSSDHHGLTRSTSTDVSESSELFDDDSCRCRTQKKKSVTFLDTEKLHIFSEKPSRRQADASRMQESKKTKMYAKIKKKNTLGKHGDRQTNSCGKRGHVSCFKWKTPRQETGKTSAGLAHSAVGGNVKQAQRRAIRGAVGFVGTYRSSSIESVRASLCNIARKEWSREKHAKTNPQRINVMRNSSPDRTLSEKATFKQIRSNERAINADPSRQFKTNHRRAAKRRCGNESGGIREDTEKRSLDERLLEALLYQKRDRMRRSRSVELAPLGGAAGKTTASPKRETSIRAERSCENSKNRSSSSEKPSTSTGSVLQHSKSSGLKKLHKAARPRKKSRCNVQRKKKKLNPEVRSARRRMLMSSKSEVNLSEAKKKFAQPDGREKRNLPRRKCAQKLESCHLLTSKEFDAAKCHHSRGVRRARSEPSLPPMARPSTTKKINHKRSNSERHGRVINPARRDKTTHLKTRDTNVRIKRGASTSQRTCSADLVAKSRVPSFKRSQPRVSDSPDSSTCRARHRKRKKTSSISGGFDDLNRRETSRLNTVNQRKDGFRLTFAQPYQQCRSDHSGTALGQQLNDASSSRKKAKKKRVANAQRKKFVNKSDRERTFINFYAPSTSNSLQENDRKSSERQTLKNDSFCESNSFHHNTSTGPKDPEDDLDLFLDPEEETAHDFEDDEDAPASKTSPSAAEPEGRSGPSTPPIEPDPGEFWCKSKHCVKNVSRKFVGLLQNGVEKLMRDVTSTFELVSVMEEMAVKEIVQHGGCDDDHTGFDSSASEGGDINSSEVLLVSMTSGSEHCWTPKFSDSQNS